MNRWETTDREKEKAAKYWADGLCVCEREVGCCRERNSNSSVVLVVVV